jgi:hypothetical protein
VAVYAIKNTRTRSIKIGFSTSPDERLKTLQTANEAELELVAFFENGTLQFEDRLHQILDGYEERVRGEWFHGPVTDCVASVLSLMNTTLGIHAFKALLRRLDEMNEEQRCYLSALIEAGPDECVETCLPEQVVLLLSEEARAL